jgi:myo-inositol-1(or 4)-monophosphatase
MKTVLINALRKAGELQREKYNQVLNISLKESISSIVTEVDVACESEIIAMIRRRFESHNILGEESGFLSKGSAYTWVIDPLDGTSNYAAGIPWFGVLIALFHGSEPVMAGAYLPISDTLYFAEKGKGAFVNDKKLEIKPVDLSASLFAFSADYTQDEEYLEKGIAWYKYMLEHARNVRSTNSLVDMMLVLEGKFGGSINIFTRIWDIAAPYLLFEEAGGVLTGLYEQPLVFDLTENAGKINYPVIAGSKPQVGNILNDFTRNYRK